MQFADQVTQPLRKFGDDFPNRARRVFDDALEDRESRGGTERRMAYAHGVQNAAEAEQIGAAIDRFSRSLFGCHVHRCPRDGAALRQAAVIDGTGQAEVRDLHALLDIGLEQDIRRFDVAVNQLPGVSGRQTVGGVLPDAKYLGKFERPGAIEALLQSLAVDVLHHQVWDRFLLDGIDLHDIVVVHAAGVSCFAHKRFRGGEVVASFGDITLTATTRCRTSSNVRSTTPKPPLPIT